MVEGRHCIKEVGYMVGSVLKCSISLLVVGIRMSYRNGNFICKLFNKEIGTLSLRSKGYKADIATAYFIEPSKDFHIRIHYILRILSTHLFRRNERPLHIDSKHPGMLFLRLKIIYFGKDACKEFL